MKVRDIPDDTLLAWFSVLDEEERAKATRFHFTADRRQYVAAHALLRSMLAGYVGEHPKTLRFCRAKRGRPELEGIPHLRFSLSHTRGVVACAVAGNDAVGMDVESWERTQGGMEIADSFFAPAEAWQVRNRGEEAFLRLWTLKEAYIKATGEGLARPLDSFSFSLDPIQIDDRGARWAWSFEHVTAIPGHLAAIALPRSGAYSLSIDVREVGHAELSKSWVSATSGPISGISESNHE